MCEIEWKGVIKAPTDFCDSDEVVNHNIEDVDDDITPKISLEDIERGLRNGMLICGDSGKILKKFPKESIDLIYCDPPFNSKKGYNWIWNDYDPTKEIVGFNDVFEHGMDGYIAYMEPILRECWRVLKPTGSIYLHCDKHAFAYLTILMDEIFIKDKDKNKIGGTFCNGLIWEYAGGIKSSKRMFLQNHDNILLYTKTNDYTFHPPLIPYTEKQLARYNYEDEIGKFKWDTQRVNGEKVRKKVYLKEGTNPGSVIYCPRAQGNERGDYATPKPGKLLKFYMETSSDEGNVVLEPFAGGGVMLREAQKKHRIPIGIDTASPAIGITKNRLNNNLIEVYGTSKEEIKKYVERNIIYEERYDELRNMDHYDFQTMMCQMEGAVPGPRGPDGGIDGTKYTEKGKIGVQVKRSENIGVDVYDLFKRKLEVENCIKGILIAFSFGTGCIQRQGDDLNNPNTDNHIPIELKTVEQIFEYKDEEMIEKFDDLINKPIGKRPQPAGKFFNIKG